MSKKKLPPKLPLRFFRWFCHPDYVEDIEGDLLERFEKRKEEGKAARWLFVLEVIRLMRPSIIKSYQMKNSIFWAKWKHYTRITFRVFSIHKLITAFSLLCLMVGGVCVTFLYSWIDNESSMDDFHSKKSQIHLLMQKATPMSKPRPSSGLYEIDKYPEVRDNLYVQVYNEDGEAQVEYANEERTINLWAVGDNFFRFFDFPLKSGDTATVFEQPKSIVLSQELSERIFGDLDPVGKYVKLHCEGTATYRVAGVTKEIPSNSSMKFDALVSRKETNIRWSRMGTNFLLTQRDFDKKRFDEKIAKAIQDHHQFPEGTLFTKRFDEVYFGTPFFTNVFSEFGNEAVVSNMKMIAIVILLICSFGFTNLQHILQLSSGRSLAIRCITGATRSDLFLEICVSRLYLLLVASIFSASLVIALFPAFNSLVQNNLTLDLFTSITVIVLIGAGIVVSSLILSGIFIYRINIINAFSKVLPVGRVPTVQRAVTVFQFAITIILLISSLVVYLQYDFMIHKDLGMDPKNVVSLKLTQGIFRDQNMSRDSLRVLYQEEQGKYNYVRSELRKDPDILAISQGELPIEGASYPMDHKLVGSDQTTTQNILTVDPGYKSILDLEMIQGRFFSDSLDSSRGKSVVINEAAWDYWRFDDLLNARIENIFWGEFKVVGVVKDFHYQHLSSRIEPLILYYMQDIENSFLLKLQREKEAEALKKLEDLHAEINPKQWFQYRSLENELQAQYGEEKLTMKVYGLFTSVAIILSFTSLFAFAWSEARRRVKEMGIRKVHGANRAQIFIKLGNSFLKLIALSFTLSCPVVWYFLRSWLDNYSYRIDLEVWYFLVGGIAAFMLSFLAVFMQSWSVARKNPVEVLRYE